MTMMIMIMAERGDLKHKVEYEPRRRPGIDPTDKVWILLEV